METLRVLFDIKVGILLNVDDVGFLLNFEHAYKDF